MSERGYVGEFFVWLLGRALISPMPVQSPNSPVTFYGGVPLWLMAPTSDYFSLTIQIHKAPCAPHRLMQWLLLGIRYKRNPDSL